MVHFSRQDNIDSDNESIDSKEWKILNECYTCGCDENLFTYDFCLARLCEPVTFCTDHIPNRQPSCHCPMSKEDYEKALENHKNVSWTIKKKEIKK